MSLKSPKLIVIAVSALWLDSVINLVISCAPSYVSVCVLSIFCTLTVHYLGYSAIVFRAFRVFRVMMVESNYLK